MTARKTKAVAIGIVVAFVGLLLVWGALAPLTEDRDADGYYMSDPFVVDRPSHAIVTSGVDFMRGRYETVTESSIVLAFAAEPDDVRMQGVASASNAVFMGIAPTAAVDEYIAGAAHDEITGWDYDRASIQDVEYTTHEGTGTPGPPGNETFWVASVAGTEQQTLDWTIESGEWTSVIMNADASSPVTAELAFGAASSNILAIAWTSLVVGVVALMGGGSLVYFGFRRRDRRADSAPAHV